MILTSVSRVVCRINSEREARKVETFSTILQNRQIAGDDQHCHRTYQDSHSTYSSKPQQWTQSPSTVVFCWTIIISILFYNYISRYFGGNRLSRRHLVTSQVLYYFEVFSSIYYCQSLNSPSCAYPDSALSMVALGSVCSSLTMARAMGTRRISTSSSFLLPGAFLCLASCFDWNTHDMTTSHKEIGMNFYDCKYRL